MTLVDTLDTLVIIGDFDEFEHAVKLVIDNVSFDHDIIISVFETNIRMVGWVFNLSNYYLLNGKKSNSDYRMIYRNAAAFSECDKYRSCFTLSTSMQNQDHINEFQIRKK